MSWIKDIINPQVRQWEEFYRNRWQHDKVVRSTHGVNCTGGCSWMIYVKNGIVTWEMQALDYPKLESSLPLYEPRGCQRGIVYSWYIYSPIRIKYPYVRGVLLDLWQEARARYNDPVAAWASIVENEERRQRISRRAAKADSGARAGKKAWKSSPLHCFTRRKSTAPIPASPETWGEKTDVAESADWFNSKYIVTEGSNLSMTRTPDVHFVAEARSHGAKLVVLSPDFSQVSKFADWWIPVNAGMDAALWTAVNHVVLKEFHVDRQVLYFTDYLKRYSDAPFLVELEKTDDGYRSGRLLRASRLARYHAVENAEWKVLVFDESSQEPRMPQGSIGFRWQSQKGHWNLQMKDGLDGSEINPQLSLLGHHEDTLPVRFLEFGTDGTVERSVPVRRVETGSGPVTVTTVFDLLMAQFGVARGLNGEYPSGYDDETTPYTPAWQEKFTGVGRNTVVQLAREFATTAEKTKGKCTIIVGSGINHWYHSNLNYRSGITTLILCGCVGVNGGGRNHYTGQRCPGFREFNERERIRDGELPKHWHRLMLRVRDHFFQEAKTESWFDAIVISAEIHPRAIRTMEYADHCEGIWNRALLESYPLFELWRRDADRYVDIDVS